MSLFARCRHEVEDDPGSVAFVRWYLLKTRWLTICLHKFLKSDHWAPHNHEYDSVSLILWGRYLERWQVPGFGGQYVRHIRRAWRPWFRSARVFHSIALCTRTVWTLFFQFNYADPEFPVGYIVGRRFIPLVIYDAVRGRKPDDLEFSGTFFPRVTRR
jgi:hypothetical protein